MHSFGRWEPRLCQAHAPEAVLSVMREYVDSLLPSELAHLPRSCQNLRFHDAQSLCESALVVLREDLTFGGDELSARQLRHMARTFCLASARMTEVTPPIAEKIATGPAVIAG